MATVVEHRAERALQPPQLQPCSQSPRPHSTMKVLAATLLALLLMFSCSPSEAHLDSVPTSCCISYQQQPRPIPLRLIDSIFTTSSSCTKLAVIVITKKGKQLCLDPREPWVQERLKHFQNTKN